MKFHKEGRQSLLLALIVSATLFSISTWLCPNNKILVYILNAIALFVLIIILQFFRSPTRQHNININSIIAPADGKVVVIEEVMDTEYFKEKKLQVSIFMSPLNVHVNRYPISGDVVYTKYHPGKFLVASLPKSSTENERTTIVVKHPENHKEVLLRQIAGFLARRIVMYSKTNDKAVQCQELGFIKFGSRVDLLLPLDCKLKVNIGDVCKGSQTVIAEF